MTFEKFKDTVEIMFPSCEFKFVSDRCVKSGHYLAKSNKVQVSYLGSVSLKWRIEIAGISFYPEKL